MDVAEKAAIKGIDIATYLVKDVERATKFYTDTMGMKVTMDYRGQGAEFTFGDDTTFGIWERDETITENPVCWMASAASRN